MEPRLDVMETGLERYAFRDKYYGRQGSFSSPRNHYSTTHHLPSFSASQPSLYQANDGVRTVRREEVFIQNHRQESFKLEPPFAFLQDDKYGRQDWSHEGVDEKQGRKWSSSIRDGASQNSSSPQRHHGFMQEGVSKQQEARYFRSQTEQPCTHQVNNYGRQEWSHEAGGFASMDEKQGRKWSAVRAGGSQKPSSPQRHGFVQEGFKQQEARHFRSQPEQPYTYQVRPETVDEEMEVMDAFEAVRRHGGMLIIDYSNRK